MQPQYLKTVPFLNFSDRQEGNRQNMWGEGRGVAGAGIPSCKELFLSSLFCPSDVLISPALESPYLENCCLMITSNTGYQ